MRDGSIVNMQANEYGKLPPKKERKWLHWSPDRATIEVLKAQSFPGDIVPPKGKRKEGAEAR